MKLIDKDALVAKIESKKKYAQILGDNAINSSMQQFYDGMKQGCVDLLSFINTLEVKEVNLDESTRHNLLHEHISPLNEVLHQADLKVEMQYHKDIKNAFKAGFELGLKENSYDKEESD